MPAMMEEEAPAKIRLGMESDKTPNMELLNRVLLENEDAFFILSINVRERLS